MRSGLFPEEGQKIIRFILWMNLMIVLTKILRLHIWMEDLIKSPPHTRDFSRELGGASI